jgi:endonuclease/exonuclease/phosphatase family metal-dependent hydrolase
VSVETGDPSVDVIVGTFNLNNLFSRFNFRGEVSAKKAGDTTITATYTFDDPASYELRTFQGRLVTGKDPKDTDTIAKRIVAMDLDVLAVQEVEDLDTLERFNAGHLGGRYPFVVLVEGNDPRLIDVALPSKMPIGSVTSWQKAVHPADPSEPVFSRDLLQVEILSSSRGLKLFTLFNNHLKSHFLSPGQTQAEADGRRQRQAEIAAKIIQAEMQPDSRFVVVGDMNDPPNSVFLAPLVAAPGLNMTNALTNPAESQPPKLDNPPVTTTAWTDRFKESGKPAVYSLFDQIWLSPSLAGHLTHAEINRRTNLTGDGSDHDPAWPRISL